jgi:predicted transport protein
MPLFQVNGEEPPDKLGKKVFEAERELQNCVESHLDDFFKIKFLDSEVATGKKHGGRIDTLGIDQNGSPVIIEYKKDQARDIINQGLFYLDWLVDHQGDFQVLLQENVDSPPDNIQWDRPRVILIANNFTKYDRHAVRRMGENIELKEYTLYENDLLEFEDVYVPSTLEQEQKTTDSDKKEYTVKDHLNGDAQGLTGVDSEVQEMFEELRNFILQFDEVSEVPVKQYIAYKASTNFCCVRIKKGQLNINLDVDPKEVNDPQNLVRDVSDIGHQATGEAEIKIQPVEKEKLEAVNRLIEISYRENS